MKVVATIGMAAVVLGSCTADNRQPPAGPPQVGFVTIAQAPVTLTTELPGRTSAAEVSEVRPQVSGLIMARLFTEGQSVRQGQALYRIDAAPYQARLASAQAGLARARAAVAAAEGLARRYDELAAINGVSQQERENATAAADQANADVAAQAAAVRSAQIDLARTTIRAPISGRIGRSVFTEGALVTASQPEPLATIQRLDRVYVDIQQSSAQALALRRQIASGALARADGGARITLRLEDGSIYAQDGVLQFTDVTVDPGTGSQILRASFANPEGILLPGMFVRARLAEGVSQAAILVPQRAVDRDPQGAATVLVVGADSRLQPRPIKVSRTIGQDWLVSEGLRPGDRVVVEGAQMLQPGTPVQASPYRPAAPVAAGAPTQAPAK